MKKIIFAYPNSTIALTTTGDKCSLGCAHCNGHYLKNMTSIEDYVESINENEKELDTKDLEVDDKNIDNIVKKEIFKYKNREITSILLSGGCSFEGDVPLIKHLDTIKYLKERGYKLNSHLGLMAIKDIEEICKYIDVASFDMVFDRETIKEVYKMDKTKEDYIKVYETLKKYIDVSPHICIGLKGGEIVGEYEVIDYLSKNPPSKVTFIVLIPTKHTEYENVDPPKLEEVEKILKEARLKLPNTQINLGCMRPRGNYRQELDVIAIKCGVDTIVLPSKKAIRYAIENGYEIQESRECCVL